MKFVARLKDGERMTDLCREFGISRKTGYKFLERYERYSAIGLHDLRRVPVRIPHRTTPEIAELIIETRREHPTWGPRKLRGYLAPRNRGLRFPAPSTIGDLLSRRGLIEPTRRRVKPVVTYSPLCHAKAPNDVWSVDFKGQFRLGNRRYCYPLTMADAATRFLLSVEGLENTKTQSARPVFEACFREYGLPGAIRSDNGAPFASTGLAGWSRLSIWWLRLGIALERTEPASPEQNGRHERMHRTLKAETTRPPGQNLLQQQERFDRFREIFNHERPHEALGQRTPGELYEPSPRPYSDALVEPEYPLHDTAVTVGPAGHVYIPGTGKATGHVFVSTALAGELVGVRELDDRLWLVSFLQHDLGVIDVTTSRFSARPTEPTADPEPVTSPSSSTTAQ
jgi:transposase InsO family protein